MTRLAALVAAVLLVPTSAVADGPIATSAAALVRRSAEAATVPARGSVRRSVSAEQVPQPASLGSSGMSRGKKLMIGLGLAAAFGAIIWTIDHKVEDNTPSSRGLR
jgi:cytoskeletal protein RodZ